MSESLRKAASGAPPQYRDVDGAGWINQPPILDASSDSNRTQAVAAFIAALPPDEDWKIHKSIARNMLGTGGLVFEYIFHQPAALIQVSTDRGLVILNLVANPDTKGGGTTMIEYVLSKFSASGVIGVSRIAEDASGFYQYLGFSINGGDGVLDASKSDRWANVSGSWCFTYSAPPAAPGNTIGTLIMASGAAPRSRSSSVGSEF